MHYFIGHESALRFLLWENSYNSYSIRRVSTNTHPTVKRPSNGHRPSRTILKSKFLPIPLRDSQPLTLCVGNHNLRSRSKELKCRIWNGPEWGSFRELNKEFCVSTPEACFLQMAQCLNLYHLIELGYLLCGTYAPNWADIPKTHSLTPLTSSTKLARYMQRAEGLKGRKNALRALRYINDRSASIMETKLIMLLCLPQPMGGLGIPTPLLNAQVVLPRKLSGRTATNVRRPDFYWPKQSVALEYDSNRHHSTSDEIASDAMRKNELTTFGIHCLVSRWNIISNPTKLERLADELASLLSFRRQTTVVDHPQRVAILRRQLLGEERWRFLENPRHS